MEPLVIVIGAPRLSDIKTKYRRFYLYDALRKKDNVKVFWATSTSLLSKCGIFENEIVFHHNKIFKGFDVKPTSHSKKIAENIKRKHKTITLVYTLHRYSFLINLFPEAKVYYDCSDNWIYKLNSIKMLTQYYSQRKILRKAKGIIFSSSYLRDRYSKKGINHEIIRSPGVIIQNKKKPKLDGGVIIGHLDSKKYSYRVINNILRMSSLTVYGSIDDELLRKISPNNLLRLKINEFLPKEELLPLLGQFRFSLLPYNNSKFTKGIYPFKIFELLNARCLIVYSGGIELGENDNLGIIYHSNFHISNIETHQKRRVEAKIEEYLIEHNYETYEQKIHRFLDL